MYVVWCAGQGESPVHSGAERPRGGVCGATARGRGCGRRAGGPRHAAVDRRAVRTPACGQAAAGRRGLRGPCATGNTTLTVIRS